MDKAQELLQEKATTDPSNGHRFRAVVTALQKLLKADLESANTKSEIDKIATDFKSLETDGLWETTGKDRDTLNELLGSLNSWVNMSSPRPMENNTEGSANNISIVIPPTSLTLLESTPWTNALYLPHELLEELNRVYFLHILATSPQDVLPEGKSLLSVMTHPYAQGNHNEDEHPHLRKKVEEIVHKAFWDEAYESLSNPSPTKQLARLRGLYSDIHASVSSVIPSSHPVMVVLTSPMSPTSAPLKSALRHLREILSVMKERCAPIRDNEVDTAIDRADGAASARTSDPLSRVLVDIAKFILEFSELMKSDMAQFVMGRLNENELNAAVSRYALESEKSIIITMWGSEYIQNSWKEWLDESNDGAGEHEVKWISKLLYCLRLNRALTCDFSHVSIGSHKVDLINDVPQTTEATGNVNLLPPPFMFVSPALLRIQNIFQALAVAALLRTLIPLSPTTHTASPDTVVNAPFMQRIWSLLTNVMETDATSNDTKLLNLADEVIRERHRSRDLRGVEDVGEDERIRKAVNRLLSTTDPAFKLLQNRLFTSISSHISLSTPASGVPRFMRTGTKRTRLAELPADSFTEYVGNFSPPKGYEDPVLVEEIKKVIHDLQIVVRWIKDAWKGTLEGVS